MEPISPRRNIGRRWLSCLALLALAGVSFRATRGLGRSAAGSDGFPIIGLLYAVNTTGDADLVGSSNFCDSDPNTPGDQCTLRAAIEASNLQSGEDGIEFIIPATDPNFDPATGRATIKLNSALPALTEGVSIQGPGASKLTVRRDVSTAFRIFKVTAANGTVAISGMTMTNGSADIFSDPNGGVVQNTNGATVKIIDCVVSDSVASEGGGIDNKSTGTIDVTNSTISGNGADVNGGIFNENTGTINIANCFITVNTAFRFGGGGIYNGGAGTVNATNTLIANNQSQERGGGGVKNTGGGTVNLIRCTISNNFDSTDDGGGIYNGSGIVNIDASMVNGNSGKGGGGILNLIAGTVNITQSTVSQNNSTGDNTFGGGLLNQGTATITNSTFAGNSGLTDGAGIFSNAGATLTVTNSTITGNTSAGTSHSPGDGAGIRTFGGPSVQVKSSLVALNHGPGSSPDLSGSFTSGGFNLVGKIGNATGFNAATDQKGTLAAPLDPKLDPAGLKDNGGLTQTIALLMGSPALDKGSSNGLTGNLTTDQRGPGFPRTVNDPAISNAMGGDGTDIGAFEKPIATPTPTPTPTPSPTPGALGNISTRLRVETGDKVLIGGFIITGTQPKKLMVRAIGPSIPLAGVLANPTLELRNGAGALVANNDNWLTNANHQDITNTGIAPSNALESAILKTVNPGTYTAIVRGANNTTGIALVEVYDLDRSANSQFANISTRGLVQSGNNVMIGGFIVVGNTSQKVIVRSLGPSVPVAGRLANPTLELRDGNGTLLAANDDWRTAQQAAIIATGIPPANNLESAIVRTLTPGAYTAIVRGKNNTTGVALVEVYALD